MSFKLNLEGVWRGVFRGHASICHCSVCFLLDKIEMINRHLMSIVSLAAYIRHSLTVNWRSWMSGVFAKSLLRQSGDHDRFRRSYWQNWN